MFRKLGRSMTRHDFGHDFFLHKAPHPITSRPLIVGQEFFNGVVIERGWGHAMQLRQDRHYYADYLRSIRSTSSNARSWPLAQLKFCPDGGNSCDPWRDFTSIRAKPFLPRTDSR